MKPNLVATRDDLVRLAVNVADSLGPGEVLVWKNGTCFVIYRRGKVIRRFRVGGESGATQQRQREGGK